MFFNWLAREGWMIVSWWALATLAGAAALPLVLRLLRHLPDRGYAVARAAGILLTAFVFWLLTSFGFLRNEAGSIAFAWLIVLGIGAVVFWRLRATDPTPDLRAWWREHRWAVIAVEVLFVVLLVGWTTYRAFQNDLNGTEKPMDLAFLSSSIRSETFPPADPWLSGYAISYYHFGYIIGGMFGTLSAIPNTIAYNLWTAMLFALTGIGAFGVVYNLVRSRRAQVTEDALSHSNRRSPSVRTGILVGLVGVLFLLIMGNWQTALVELPHNLRWASADYLRFWGVEDRQEPLPGDPLPLSEANASYFAASRTMDDLNLPTQAANMGPNSEVITEFPQFSFVLADNHPHVMALPFTLLAMALALNVALGQVAPRREEILFYGIVVGALAFLNTWDSPVYLLLIVGGDALRRLRQTGRLAPDDWVQMGLFGGAMLVIALVAFLPFIVTFSSQLGGALPNLAHPTRFQQFVLAFGALVPITALFLGVEAWRGIRTANWRMGWLLSGGILLLLVLAMAALTLGGVVFAGSELSDYIQRSGGIDTLISESLAKRATHIVTALVLALGLVVVIARLFPRRAGEAAPLPDGLRDELAETGYISYPTATGFALLLVGAGLGLALIPEFVYLRDNFSTRMNTVFKFYYIAWAMLSVAGAYGVYSILTDPRLRLPVLPVRALTGAVVGVAVVLAMAYPLVVVPQRMSVEGTRVPIDGREAVTLDGWRSFLTEDDYNVLMCLSDLVGREPVTVAEGAFGGSYDFGGAGRTGALTGMPTILGWAGHQAQWRGRGYGEAVGSRLSDVERLYTALQLQQVTDVIDLYSIDYIFYGTTEQRQSTGPSDDNPHYGTLGLEKFIAGLNTVCQSGSSYVFATGRGVNTVALE